MHIEINMKQTLLRTGKRLLAHIYMHIDTYTHVWQHRNVTATRPRCLMQFNTYKITTMTYIRNTH